MCAETGHHVVSYPVLSAFHIMLYRVGCRTSWTARAMRGLVKGAAQLVAETVFIYVYSRCVIRAVCSSSAGDRISMRVNSSVNVPQWLGTARPRALESRWVMCFCRCCADERNRQSQRVVPCGFDRAASSNTTLQRTE
jgi:hypothetical protein